MKEDTETFLARFVDASVMRVFLIDDFDIWKQLNSSTNVRGLVAAELFSLISLKHDPDHPDYATWRYLMSLDATSVTRMCRIISCFLFAENIKRLFEHHLIAEISVYCGTENVVPYIHRKQFPRFEPLSVGNSFSMTALEDLAVQVRSLVSMFGPSSVRTYLQCIFPPQEINSDVEISEKDLLVLAELIGLAARVDSFSGVIDA